MTRNTFGLENAHGDKLTKMAKFLGATRRPDESDADLRFQKAAMGEPSDEVIRAGKDYFDQARDCCGFKAMIAELAKQVKENEDGR